MARQIPRPLVFPVEIILTYWLKPRKLSSNSLSNANNDLIVTAKLTFRSKFCSRFDKKTTEKPLAKK